MSFYVAISNLPDALGDDARSWSIWRESGTVWRRHPDPIRGLARKGAMRGPLGGAPGGTRTPGRLLRRKPESKIDSKYPQVRALWAGPLTAAQRSRPG
jgi:hypothetical protein